MKMSVGRGSHRADQNTGGTLLEFMRTAMHRTSCVSSAISLCNIYIFIFMTILPSGAVARLTRRWSLSPPGRLCMHFEIIQ